MAKQSELERLSIDKRAEELVRSHYGYSENNEYEEGHKNAVSDGDEKGKGTNTPSTYLSITTKKDPSASKKNTVDTENGGGKYDIKGYGALEGTAGRDYLLHGGINAYTPENEYGPNSVDTSANVTEGQYVVDAD